MMPRRYFSVVLPVYNKEDYIESAIASVRAQNYPYWELIVVDDGSTDSSAIKVFTIADADSRVKMISQRNRGVSSARNAGIRNAQFDEICFLDADDAWKPDHLSVLNDLADRYPRSAMLFTQCLVVKDGVERGDPWFKATFEETGLLHSYCQAMAKSPNIINSSNVCIRKSVAGNELSFNENDSVGEDLDVWLRVSRVSPVAFCSRGCALYNRDTTQNARTRNAVHFPRGYFETITKLLGDDAVSAEDKAALYHVRDRKMVAYVFSLLSCGERKRARTVLASWSAGSAFGRLKPALWMGSYLPRFVLSAVKSARMRLA